MRSVMSIIDVVAILPYYIGLGLTTENDDVSGNVYKYNSLLQAVAVALSCNTSHTHKQLYFYL